MSLSRLVPSVLLSTALCLSTLVTTSVTTSATTSATAAEPAPSPRAGYGAIVAWAGGVAMACRAPASGGQSAVRVYWNGRNYRDGDLKHSGSAGLARVSTSFEISDYTYSTGKPGGVGPVARLSMASSAYVYILVGSGIGITREVVVPVGSLALCGAGRTTASYVPVDGHPTARRACVTKKELKKVTRGLQPAGVRRLVGAKGTVVTSASESLTRRYPKCTGGRAVVVNFQKAGPRKPAKVVSRFW